MLDQPSIAILIDCWAGDTRPNALLYSNILNFLNNPNIETVVLASYNVDTEFRQSNTIWYENYHNLFFRKQSLRKVKHLYDLQKTYNFTNYVLETDPRILNYVNPDKFQISMLWSWQLEYYLNCNPRFKNIYVLGAAWEHCIKQRPLGYSQLTEITDSNILIDTSCILTLDAIHPVLSNDQEWKQIKESVWKYHGN